MTTVEKESGETADLTINWATFLGTRTISSSAWTVPSGLTEGAKSATTTTTTLRTSGGTTGTEYVVLNTTTLNNGEIRTHRVRVKVRVQS